MFCRLLFLTGLTLVLAASATAEPYWISYDGNDFPENEGWERTFCDQDGIVGQGGAIRSLEDGALVLDSRESTMIVDFYEMQQPIDPGPGEMFVMEWRLRVDDVSAREDPGIAIFSDDSYGLAFELSTSYIASVFESDVTISFEEGVFHSFAIHSADMRSYELTIDETLAYSGVFTDVFMSSRMNWGDGVQGAASLATWDYVRFGVIPEPSSWLLLVVTATTLCFWRVQRKG